MTTRYYIETKFKDKWLTEERVTPKTEAAAIEIMHDLHLQAVEGPSWLEYPTFRVTLVDGETAKNVTDYMVDKLRQHIEDIAEQDRLEYEDQRFDSRL